MSAACRRVAVASGPASRRGFTLVELLVAITIGLFILGAAGALFSSSNAAYVAQGDTAGADQAGRYALDVIGRALRQSGFVDWEHVDLGAAADTASPARLAGLDARSISKNSDGIADPLADTVNGSDVLAVRFPGAGPAPHGDGSMLTCAGFSVASHDEGWSIFYVARGTDGAGELRCKYRAGGSWGADAVISGVDSFQVLYGLDTDEPADGVPNRYVNATALNELDAALILAGATAAERGQDLLRRTRWKRVVSVQYALLLRGAKSDGRGRERVYDMFGQDYGDAYGVLDSGTRLREDTLAGRSASRERRLFMTTVALRGGAR
jgi:type IV pilus assembly protein PilW